MALFTGQLNTNKMFAALYNMIISLMVFDQGVSGLDGVYTSRKQDGTLYGDTKLYISTDALKSYAWDGTDTPGGYNLLTVHRPPAPKEAYIKVDQFRQIPITVDDYLTKQAFLDEGSFSSFKGTVLGWMNTTKEIYQHTKYTSDIIISSVANAAKNIKINLDTDLTGLEAYIYRGQEFFRQLEDLFKEMKEPSREYNTYQFLRNSVENDFDIVVPIGLLSQVKKLDVPFLYNPDGKPNYKEVHWKYFGTLITTSGTSDGTKRAFVEKDFTKTGGSDPIHLFPGDLIPNAYVYAANEAYTPQFTSKPSLETTGAKVILVHKRDYPILDAFSVGTSFFNARRLDANHYLTFGHNNVYDAHIGEYPLVTLEIEITPEEE